MENNRKIISIAWGNHFIDTLLTPVENRLGIDFVHLLHYDDFVELSRRSYYKDKIFDIPTEKEVLQSKVDMELLASLEKGGTFTINNLILSDRILRHLKNEESLQYATTLAKLFFNIFSKVKPIYVLGSWDSMIQGIGMLVARKMNIPFYIMKFSVIPAHHLTFCIYPYANMELDFTKQNDGDLLLKAEEVLDFWLNRKIVAPAYVSAKSFTDILRMLPFHLKEMITRFRRALFSKGNNKFLYYSNFKLIRQYFRKKTNILLMDKSLFISEVPSQPFFFYGLHMQPESSIDVMAPFYSDQYMVIESIARSMPVDHLLLVKIHVSDADNYSNSQIKRLLKIPGVRIVSPFVGSRVFIDNASILFSIQGTIGLEGALLGKSVIMFGDSPVLKFSTVSKVNKLEDLPELVNIKLKEKHPNKEVIVKNFASFLRNFLPSCSNDWLTTLKNGLSEKEKENFIVIFDRLNNYVEEFHNSQ